MVATNITNEQNKMNEIKWAFYQLDKSIIFVTIKRLDSKFIGERLKQSEKQTIRISLVSIKMFVQYY